ncbi:aspartate aminotransferase family protein [Fusibacter ferrireducens]|uniref:Aspartate aminotransferase family protein n=1 Tax=Fusibacter ferrireducens TaxID=2785058 RepID=A0ABR9ZYI6_9FIRM|nr:aspartate aminotransferase family protein [Fusibacter ferrireducens]MBF4695026.1 aspartate aminotransferase family protein [Fusibacter ferrireducens]
MLKNALPKIITELPGPKSKEIISKRNDAIPSSVACATPCVIDKAEGCMIQDVDGNIFMDWVAGIGVMNIGHSNPEIIEAVKKQTDRYFHPQINTFHYSEYVDLAAKLNSIVPGDFKKRTCFFNSGAEANDNAIKIARKYTKKTDIIAFSGGFHGRTFMTMTLTSGNIYKAAFGPMIPGVHRAEFPNEYRTNSNIKPEELVDYYIDKLEYMFVDYVSPDNVAAIILEPLQGEAGFVEPPIDYIVKLRAICDKYNILLIADEVQTGYCRTGRMFATEYWADKGVYADIVVSAKSLAAGLPLSAVTAREEIMESLAVGEIGGTYGGNAVACASALKVIEIMERDNYAQKAMAIGEQAKKFFADWYNKYEAIGTYRIKGAMLSIEFVKDRATKEPDPEMASKVLKGCKEKGLVIKNAGSYHQIIRILMPLITNEEQLNAGMNILEDVIKSCSK